MSKPKKITQHPVLTPEEIEIQQREWKRKWDSGEFIEEASQAKQRLYKHSPDLLRISKRIIQKAPHKDGYFVVTTDINALAKVVALIEGK